MIWDLPPVRPGRPPSDDLRERRALAGGRREPLIATEHTVVTLGGVRCLQLDPPASRCEILYFHGGGYRMGSPEGWLRLASSLVGACNSRVTLPDYRLAPESPYPAALHDAVAVYGTVMASGNPIFVAGDSAGGGLAAALAVLCIREGKQVPEGVFLFSPWLDLTLVSDTYTTRAETDQFFPLTSATDAADAYLQGHPATDPLASPARAELSGYPPTLVMAGTEETLLGDSLTFASALASARRDVTLHVAAGMQHAWPAIFPDLPETAHAIGTVGAFVDRVLAASSMAAGY
jgi:monoterpene epsilon-lactone hydrolase